MKKAIFLALMVLLLSSRYAASELTVEESPLNFSISFQGGVYVADDGDFREIYGRDGNDIFFIDLGYYALRNLLVEAGIGLYYEEASEIGAFTGTNSGTRTVMTFLPGTIGASYRFNFFDRQYVYPYIGGGYQYLYFSENPDLRDSTHGGKHGWQAKGGLLLHLDPLDKNAAFKMDKNWKINNTYFDLGVRYMAVPAFGSKGGIDFSGISFLGGLTFEF